MVNVWTLTTAPFTVVRSDCYQQHFTVSEMVADWH